jgi:hypothetical protein
VVDEQVTAPNRHNPSGNSQPSEGKPMSNHPVRDFLDGGRRHKALKFPTVGTEYSGRITAAPELRQQRDY